MTAPAAGQRRAFVLGGGVAGLAAALGLGDRGLRVVVLESRAWLGGRAFSSPDPATGWLLDNGPHVMLGCYRSMRRLLRRLGTEGLFEQAGRLQVAYRTSSGTSARLSLSRLPVPLSMPLALLRLPIGGSARLRALWGFLAVLAGAPAAWSLQDWLRRRRQLGAPDAYFWRPLCRAIMNVDPEHASAADFLATLREAFLGGAKAGAFWTPSRPWREILAEPAARTLTAAGAEVRTRARVGALHTAGGNVAAIELSHGERIAVGPADLVVSALPWFALRSLVPQLPPAAAALPSSPIVSAYFETPADAAPLPDDGPVVALVDGEPFHFVLRTPGGDPRRVAMLAGGNRAFDGLAVEAIVAMARAQLARHYPAWNGAARATVRIRKEQHATFVAAPGSRSRRPLPGPLAGGPQNLRICGDWTDTGLPATLEGAARSAELALEREFAQP